MKHPNLLFTWVALATSLSGLAAQADVGLLTCESNGGMAEVAGQAGHSAIYLSNICPDGGPTKLRLCKEGEQGSVLSRNTNIQGYDWTIISASEYFYGVADATQAPMISNPKVLATVVRSTFDRTLSDAFQHEPGEMAKGDVQYVAGAVMRRDIYNLRMKTTLEEDQALIERYNADPNKSHFSIWKRNCANFAKDLFNFLMPEDEKLHLPIQGMGVTTPKGMSMAISDLAKRHPEREIWVEKYNQVPGTIRRSADNLFLTEYFYKNRYARGPFAFIAGGKVSVAAFLFNDVGTKFYNLDRFYRGRPASRIAAIDLELKQLEAEKKAKGQELKGKERKAALDAIKKQSKLIQTERKVVQREMLGTDEQWDRYHDRFRDVMKAAAADVSLAPFVHELLAGDNSPGSVAKRLLQWLDQNGSYKMGDAGVELRFAAPGETEERVSGLSRSQVVQGDRSLGLVVALANVAENLHVSRHNRETLVNVELDWAALEEVSKPASAGDSELP